MKNKGNEEKSSCMKDLKILYDKQMTKKIADLRRKLFMSYVGIFMWVAITWNWVVGLVNGFEGNYAQACYAMICGTTIWLIWEK